MWEKTGENEFRFKEKHGLGWVLLSDQQPIGSPQWMYSLMVQGQHGHARGFKFTRRGAIKKVERLYNEYKPAAEKTMADANEVKVIEEDKKPVGGRLLVLFVVLAFIVAGIAIQRKANELDARFDAVSETVTDTVQGASALPDVPKNIEEDVTENGVEAVPETVETLPAQEETKEAEEEIKSDAEVTPDVFPFDLSIE